MRVQDFGILRSGVKVRFGDPSSSGHITETPKLHYVES